MRMVRLLPLWLVAAAALLATPAIGGAQQGYRLTDRWQTGQEIEPIATASDGSILTVSGEGRGRITRFDPSGKRLGSFPIDAWAPEGLSTDAAGNIYVSDMGTEVGRGKRVVGGRNRISVFNPAGTRLRRFSPPSRVLERFWPQELAVAPDGTSYVADAFGDPVIVTAPDGSYAGRIGPRRPKQQLTFTLIALSQDGSSLYILDHARYRTLQFDVASRSFVRALKHPGVQPDAIATAPDGRVIIADSDAAPNNLQLHEFGARGAYLGVSAVKMSAPTGIAADGTGALYVAGWTAKGATIARLEPRPAGGQGARLGSAPAIGRLRAPGGRGLAARVGCGAGAVGCIGRIEVRIRGRVVGRVRYAVAAGLYTDVFVGLKRRVRKALRAGSRVRASVRLTDRARGTRSRTVHLKKTRIPRLG